MSKVMDIISKYYCGLTPEGSCDECFTEKCKYEGRKKEGWMGCTDIRAEEEIKKLSLSEGDIKKIYCKICPIETNEGIYKKCNKKRVCPGCARTAKAISAELKNRLF